MNDITLNIAGSIAGLEHMRIVGFDTTIIGLNEDCYLGEALDARFVLRLLSQLSERFASELEERLHHAEWVITRDPRTVKERGMLHDCDFCRDGVERALEMLEAKPNGDLAIGALYWPGP